MGAVAAKLVKPKPKKGVGRPQGQPKDTRARALDLAERLLIERGHAATSMDDIAKRVGITKGSLYHHFRGGKDELVAAVGHQMIDRERDGMQRALGGATTTQSRLEALVRWKFSGSSHPERMLRDAQRTLPKRSSQDIERRFMVELFTQVQSVLETGVADGELEAHDTTFVAWAFLSLLSEFSAMPPAVRGEHIARDIARFTMKGAGVVANLSVLAHVNQRG
jgi:AcrR family transcriptional regulator